MGFPKRGNLNKIAPMKKSIFFILLLTSISISLYSEVQAAFDIGTGKIKMQVANVDAKTKTITSLFCKAYRIQEHSLKHMRALLETLLEEACAYSPSVLIGIATEKYRRDNSGITLIERLKKTTGIQIEVISAEKEGILAHRTVTYETAQDPHKTVVWDIGSGSFQIICHDISKFFTYTSPYGRIPFYEHYLSLSGTEEEKLQLCLEKGLPFLEAPPEIFLKKIRENNGKIICIGAYPFKEASAKMDSGQLFVKLVINALNISSVDYRWILAGNTTGLLLEYNGFN